MLKEGHLAGEGKGSGIPSSGELSNGGNPHTVSILQGALPDR